MSSLATKSTMNLSDSLAGWLTCPRWVQIDKHGIDFIIKVLVSENKQNKTTEEPKTGSSWDVACRAAMIILSRESPSAAVNILLASQVIYDAAATSSGQTESKNQVMIIICCFDLASYEYETFTSESISVSSYDVLNPQFHHFVYIIYLSNSNCKYDWN